MKKKNVLLFPAGSEIAFEIVNALKKSKFVKLYGGTSVSDHSDFIYSNLITGFPYVDDEGFLTYLNDVIDKYEIDCVYPTHDSASVFLSNHAQEINAQVIIADAFTTNTCRSKRATYTYLCEEKYIPKMYKLADDVDCFPVFVKPDVGQGAVGTAVINDKQSLESALLNDNTLVICEYLEGPEYTVDCFSDKNGKLRVVKMRDRARIRNGISVRSNSIPVDSEIEFIANNINAKFHFVGAWFFQVKKDACGKYKLLEISPRIPGTMGLSRNQGINYPMLTLFAFWGVDIDIIDNGYDIVLDRAFYSAYSINISFEHIYIDFDDTLVIDGKVNQTLIAYLYQALNEGKQIHLLSKHLGDIYESLEKYKIAGNIFCEIVIISHSDSKFKYIKEKNAIFIDDSFAERKAVSDELGIPVFDLDMVESLISWKD